MKREMRDERVIIEKHVIAVYSNNIGSLLPSRAEAEAYAVQAIGLYFRQHGYLSKKPALGHSPTVKIVSCEIEEFSWRLGMGRVIATCERSGWDSRREEKSA